MTRPFEMARLSDDAKHQVEELWQKMQAEIGLWWPDESRFRELGQEHKPLVFLSSDLLNELQPGVLGCLLRKLTDQGWLYNIDNTTLTIKDAEPIGFKDLNSILDNVANEAVFYLNVHDYEFKSYCFQTAAWTAYKSLVEIVPKLSEPFKSPVIEFTKACEEAHLAKEDTNIGYERYPLAAKEIIVLMEKLETIIDRDPGFKDGIDEEKLASLKLFRNLETTAARIAEKIRVENDQRAQKESETAPVS